MVVFQRTILPELELRLLLSILKEEEKVAGFCKLFGAVILCFCFSFSYFLNYESMRIHLYDTRKIQNKIYVVPLYITGEGGCHLWDHTKLDTTEAT